ncbi:MAG: long-chain fatty acid--CoA ligase [Actinomycetota bacterium]|nr:long-chain fatty acid--CoA ligase [Actinomycetota bacterium]
MMETPLTLRLAFDRARTLFGNKEIVTKTPDGTARTNYEALCARVERLASALHDMGVRPGDRVGTFGWNSARHLELYLAVPSMGAVLHTLNIRLHPEQVAWIANHAEDSVIFIDDSLLPAFEKVAPHVTTAKRFVIMGDGPLPETTITADSYEELVEAGHPTFAWPDLDESQACAMCYTSGTTGDPKGVVYSHRSMFLHALMSGMVDTNGVCENDRVLPVVPMFHANAWGLPWAATLTGASQIFPAQFMTPVDIARLIASERVTFAAAVPTIWIGMLQCLDQERLDLSSLERIIAGGSAVPLSLIQAYEQRGMKIVQGWGMTETGPLASLSRLTGHIEERSSDEQMRFRARQGLPVPGIELRIVGDDGVPAPWDGEAMGEVQVRGNWVARTYYNDPRSPQSWTEDGWLRTGDVGIVDPTGYVQLVDRTKDLVKSGGEWISSVDLEGALMGHPKVLEAAVIAIPHEQWSERPLACVVCKPGQRATKDELIEFLAPSFPKWWLPDDVLFLEEIPKTSVGKFDKKVLRAKFAG